ncbi:type I phosphatidylinositol 4,5-bisphosphate 4-phosphatase-A [Ciona intestinalis]
MLEQNDETESLLSTQNNVSNGEASTSLNPPSYAKAAGDLTEQPPPYSFTAPNIVTVPSDETSPVMQMAVINCRVCQTLLHVEGKLHLHVIKCYACGEATPIRPPPAQKKYVRCPCNCLLICKISSQRIVCPRSDCKRVISLKPVVPNPVSDEGSNLSRRVICAHCLYPFYWTRPSSTRAKCPQCKKTSSVGNKYRRQRIQWFGILSLISLCMAIIVNIVTYHQEFNYVLKYGLWGLLYFISFVEVIITIHFLRMRVSNLERPSQLRYT